MPFLLSKTTVSKVVSVGLSHVIFDLHESIVVSEWIQISPRFDSANVSSPKLRKVMQAVVFCFLCSKKISSYIKCVLGCHEFSSR